MVHAFPVGACGATASVIEATLGAQLDSSASFSRMDRYGMPTVRLSAWWSRDALQVDGEH